MLFRNKYQIVQFSMYYWIRDMYFEFTIRYLFSNNIQNFGIYIQIQ